MQVRTYSYNCVDWMASSDDAETAKEIAIVEFFPKC